MSDELLHELNKGEELDVEAHTRKGVTEEPTEGETEEEVEAHSPRKFSPRKFSPRKF